MPDDRLPLYGADDNDDDADYNDVGDADHDDFDEEYEIPLNPYGTPFGAPEDRDPTKFGPVSFDHMPAWLRDIEELANRELKDGSSCEQVHPHVARWYEQAHASGPLESRDSILQAMACLSTEVLNSAPDEVLELLDVEDEDLLMGWIEYVLFIGRAFEHALKRGEFDDL